MNNIFIINPMYDSYNVKQGNKVLVLVGICLGYAANVFFYVINDELM